MTGEASQELFTPENIAFSKLVLGHMNKWSVVFQYRMVSNLGLDPAAEKYRSYFRTIVDKMRPGGRFESFAVEPEEFFAKGYDEKMVEEAVNNAMANAPSLTDAAALVFGHSLLDKFSEDLLDVAFERDRNRFLNFILSRTVKIEDIVDAGSCSIEMTRISMAVTEKVRDCIDKNLKRDSLCEKVDHIHSLCKPPKGFLQSSEYRYDRERLAQIDARRHQIVHGPRFAEALGSVKDDLEYMLDTGNYLALVMCHGFGLKIIPVEFDSGGLHPIGSIGRP